MSRLRLCVAYVRWAASLPYFWATVALLAVTAAVLLVDHAGREVFIRWWGMLLQFLGIVMVVRDLRGAQLQFNQDGVRKRVRKAWARRPGQSVRIELKGIAATATFGRAHLSVRSPVDSTLSIEARIKAIESNLSHLDDELRRVEASFDEEVRARTNAIQEEAAVRAAADQDLHKKLMELATGSYTFSMFGVVWLAVGLVLSSASPELARWFGMLR